MTIHVSDVVRVDFYLFFPFYEVPTWRLSFMIFAPVVAAQRYLSHHSRANRVSVVRLWVRVTNERGRGGPSGQG